MTTKNNIQRIYELEANYKSIFENSVEGIFQTSPEGKLISANPSLVKICGYSCEKEMKEALKDIENQVYVNPNRRKEFIKILKDQDYIQNFESQIYRKDGSIIWISENARAMRYRNGKLLYYQGTVQDITQKKEIEAQKIKLAAEKLAREKAEAAEKRYLDLVNTLDAVVWESDIKTGEFSFVSKQAEKMFKYPLKNWLNDPSFFKKIIHPDDTEEVIEKCINQSKKGKDYEMEYRMMTADNQVIWVKDIVRLIKNSKGVPEKLRGLFIDITKQKQIESKLKESETMYRTVFELAPDVVYTLSAKNGIINSLSPSFEKLTGWKVKEIIGKNFKEIIHPDDVNLAISKYKEGLKGKSTLGFELRVLTKKGDFVVGEFRSVPIKRDGKVVEKVGIARDITKRKQMQEDLIYQKTLLEAIKESSIEGILMVDPNGKIISYNQEFLEIWKIPKKVIRRKLDADAVNYVLDQLINPKEFTEKIIYLYKNPDQVGKDELILKDGRIIERYSSPVENNQTYYGRVWFFRDITEQRQLEIKKDRFILMASHELRTPITTIKGFTQILEKHFGDNLEAGNYLSKIQVQTDRLTTLINDLLDVSKIESGKLELKKEVFDLSLHLNEICEDMQHSSRKHKIIFSGIKDATIFADKYRISQVLINLINNAIKYSPDSDKILVKLAIDKKNIQISVQDFGIGIDKNNLNKIFDAFYQIPHENRHSFFGLGLGLYIVSEIIKQHNGKIWVKSLENKGSTFFFTLPKNNKS